MVAKVKNFQELNKVLGLSLVPVPHCSRFTVHIRRAATVGSRAHMTSHHLTVFFFLVTNQEKVFSYITCHLS